jgi:hypothetical protein
VESLDQLAINKKWIEEIADYNWGKIGLRGIEIVVELLNDCTARLQITFMAACIVLVSLRADSLCTWICMS